MKQYIGITGFKTRAEVEAVNEMIEDQYIMFGILASKKRMDNPRIPGKRSPAFQDIRALTKDVRGWPVLHYFSTTKSGLAEEVLQATSNSGCKGVQLNQDWPEPQEVERLHSNDLEVILQIPKRAQTSIEEVARRAKEYEGIVNYVLVDPSGGLGEEFNLGYGVALMHALRESLPESGIGIAGGFSPTNVYNRVQELRKLFSYDFSIDTETRVRTNDTVHLDEARMKKYLSEATQAFQERELH